MSTARIRSALAPALATLGFVRRGSEFALQQSELEHVVSVYAVRRLTGFFEVFHSVFARESRSAREPDPPALVQDRIGSYSKPYLSAWDANRFDPGLAVKQVSAIVRAFRSLSDVEHFLSDRPETRSTSTPQIAASTSAPNSLSHSQTENALRGHSSAIFADHFDPAPRLGTDMWAHRQEVGGYRYCAYLQANDTATLATIMYVAFASRDIERGRKSAEVSRLLFAAPKLVLADSGQPILIPLIDEAVDHSKLVETLLSVLCATAPNLLPQRET